MFGSPDRSSKSSSRSAPDAFGTSFTTAAEPSSAKASCTLPNPPVANWAPSSHSRASLILGIVVFLLPSSFIPALTLAHHHHGRAEDAVVQLVAPLHLRDNLAFVALYVGHGLVQARIEIQAFGFDRRDAGVLQQLLQLAVDQVDAVEPGEAGQARVQRPKGALEVIEDGQQVDDQRGVGEAAAFLPLLLGAALVVLEVGLGALPVGQ